MRIVLEIQSFRDAYREILRDNLGAPISQNWIAEETDKN
jgi:hypothetical protein